MGDFPGPRRFALLVGIDFYLQGEARNTKGKRFVLNQLHGAVNDVNGIRRFLTDRFGNKLQTTVLTSSPAAQDSKEPIEARHTWPTFENIKNTFDLVLKNAKAGDLFFFHYSGHGAQLPRTSRSPNKETDPSLLTINFCQGGRPVRGWELNHWLERLNQKKVQVIILLDSCYSGGSWREGFQFRTPDTRIEIPNLPSDEIIVEGTVSDSPTRDSHLETAWSINPEGFTVMAACDSHERAAETLSGIPGGAFTKAFLEHFQQKKITDYHLTYRTLRDSLAPKLTNQTPRVYGRDRLLFFGTTEPFSIPSVMSKINGDRITLPIGEVHGIETRSEFVLCGDPTTCISIDQVEDDTCSAKIPSILSPRQHQSYPGQSHLFIPSRWSFGNKFFQVLVDPMLGASFHQGLEQALKQRIASSFQTLDDIKKCDSDAIRLVRRGDHIEIHAPERLTGYHGAVRGLSLDIHDHQIMEMSAAALTHLGRFQQILHLRGDDTCGNGVPFKVFVEKKQANEGALGTAEFAYRLHNRCSDKLYVTVLNLGPGFHIQQIFPANDSPREVQSGGEFRFGFKANVPDKLKTIDATREVRHRDIIRTLATKNKGVSWKVLELPHIWDAPATKISAQNPCWRDARVVETFEHCVVDREVFL